MPAARTWERNRDWADSDAITRATAKACLAQPRLSSLLARCTCSMETTAAHERPSAQHYALPDYSDALYWLGRLSFMENKLDDGEGLLLAASSLILAIQRPTSLLPSVLQGATTMRRLLDFDAPMLSRLTMPRSFATMAQCSSAPASLLRRCPFCDALSRCSHS